MKNLRVILFFTFICSLPLTLFSQVLVEAESFRNKGGWIIDQQFIYQIGSLYLLSTTLSVSNYPLQTIHYR